MLILLIYKISVSLSLNWLSNGCWTGMFTKNLLSTSKLWHGSIRNYCLGFHVILFLTHWGRVTDICISKLAIIGSHNGLSPDRRQAIIWTNAGILLLGPLETNFSEILIEILKFSFKKMRLKVSSAKRRPFCLGLNELMRYGIYVECDIVWYTNVMSVLFMTFIC